MARTPPRARDFAGLPLHPHMPPPNPTSAGPSATEDGGASRSFSVSHLIGVLFLVSQVVFVLQNHFAAEPTRLLTPVEGVTRYELHATFAQRPLTEDEIQSRYGMAPEDETTLTVQAVRNVVAHREKPIPLARALYVRLRTREPNGTETYWLWPQE